MAIQISGTVVVDNGRNVNAGIITATTDLDIPTGAGVAARTSTPVTGSLRFNTVSSLLEIYDGTTWLTVGVADTDLADRGIFGGFTNGLEVEYINIATTGNSFFRSSVLNSSVRFKAACSSRTRGFFAGGSAPPAASINLIEFVNIADLSYSTDFGDLTVARSFLSGCSSSTRGIFAGGSGSNIIDYITMATKGNATDFGDLTVARSTNYTHTACSSSTRGVFAGGGSTLTNIIDYITIATTGNATDFGDLTVARGDLGGCSSSTRGVFGGGTVVAAPGSTNIIDYITIATTGNATDFGDLTVARSNVSACSSSTRGIFAGGGSTNIIDYITIATTGNATDFGDLTQFGILLASCSNGHGGLL